MTTLGQKVAEARKGRGLSQRDLANEVVTSQPVISSIEREVPSVTQEKLEFILDYLGVDYTTSEIINFLDWEEKEESGKKKDVSGTKEPKAEKTLSEYYEGTLEKELLVLREKHIDLQDSYDRLAEDFSDLEQKYDAMAPEYEELKSIHEGLIRDYGSSEKEYEVLKQEHEVLRQEYMSYNALFQELKEGSDEYRSGFFSALDIVEKLRGE